MTGLFSVGGKTMVSLSIRNSSSFTLSPGQRNKGIKLLQVKGDADPHAIVERNGLQGRVFLYKSRPSVPVPAKHAEVMTEKRKRGFAPERKHPYEILPLSHGSLVQQRTDRRARTSMNEPFTEMRYTKDGSKGFEISVMWTAKSMACRLPTGILMGSILRKNLMLKANFMVRKFGLSSRWGDKWRETTYVNGKEHGMQD